MKGQRIICPHCNTVFSLNKNYYEKRILNLLRKRGGMSFTELLQATQFTRATLARYLTQLCNLGKIVKQKGYKLKETQK